MTPSPDGSGPSRAARQLPGVTLLGPDQEAP